MAPSASTRADPPAVETLLGDALASADRAVAMVPAGLRQLLDQSGRALLSDRRVAQVASLLHDLATKLARGSPGRAAALAAGLAADERVLGHLHALAVEAELTDCLSRSLALDPVLPPLLENLLASPDAAAAADAAALLEAQARFVQAQRRGECAIEELPDDVLDAAQSAARAHLGEAEIGPVRSEGERRRAALLGRLVVHLGTAATLDVTKAGVALFLSACAVAGARDRDDVVLAAGAGQAPRLVLTLLAIGLGPAEVRRQLLAIHPETALPDDFDSLTAQRASALLGAAGR